MRRSIFLACLIVAAFAGIACADSIEECEARCRKQNDACMAQAGKFVNDIEVQDAQAVCSSNATACYADCMAAEQEHKFDRPKKAKEGDDQQQ